MMPDVYNYLDELMDSTIVEWFATEQESYEIFKGE
jgi:hypothetical protein